MVRTQLYGGTWAEVGQASRKHLGIVGPGAEVSIGQPREAKEKHVLRTKKHGIGALDVMSCATSNSLGHFVCKKEPILWKVRRWVFCLASHVCLHQPLYFG